MGYGSGGPAGQCPPYVISLPSIITPAEGILSLLKDEMKLKEIEQEGDGDERSNHYTGGSSRHPYETRDDCGN